MLADGTICFFQTERVAMLEGAKAVEGRPAVAFQAARPAQPAVAYQAAVAARPAMPAVAADRDMPAVPGQAAVPARAEIPEIPAVPAHGAYWTYPFNGSNIPEANGGPKNWIVDGWIDPFWMVQYGGWQKIDDNHVMSNVGVLTLINAEDAKPAIPGTPAVPGQPEIPALPAIKKGDILAAAQPAIEAQAEVLAQDAVEALPEVQAQAAVPGKTLEEIKAELLAVKDCPPQEAIAGGAGNGGAGNGGAGNGGAGNGDGGQVDCDPLADCAAPDDGDAVAPAGNGDAAAVVCSAYCVEFIQNQQKAQMQAAAITPPAPEVTSLSELLLTPQRETDFVVAENVVDVSCDDSCLSQLQNWAGHEGDVFVQVDGGDFQKVTSDSSIKLGAKVAVQVRPSDQSTPVDMVVNIQRSTNVNTDAAPVEESKSNNSKTVIILIVIVLLIIVIGIKILVLDKRNSNKG